MFLALIKRETTPLGQPPVVLVTGVFIKDKNPIIVDERRDRSVDLMIFDKRSSSAAPYSTEPSMPKFYPLDASHGPAMALLSAHLLLEPTPQQNNALTTLPFHQYLQQQQQQQPQSMYYCTPMLPPMPSHTPQQQHPLVTPLYSQPTSLLGYYPTPSPQSPLNQLQPQLSNTPSHTRRKPVRPLYQQQQQPDDERPDSRTITHHHQHQEQSRQHRIPRKQPQYRTSSNNSQPRRVRFANTLQVMTYDAEDDEEQGEEQEDIHPDPLHQQEQEQTHRRGRDNRVFGLYTPPTRKRSYHPTSYY
ncbi:hypothetical protein K492DRAFT_207144 [Lichtheimia hyalospora FSU 10163]|nr:hypothetical protein K492DRAFT_207144 [Lichtheimia hyalospora FSU 10163]